MSILEGLTTVLSEIGALIETGVFSETPPDQYIVITPMTEMYVLYAEDKPVGEWQEARLSVFSKPSYTALKNRVIAALLGADFTITERLLVGREDDTGYYHYAIDVAKYFHMEV